MDVENEKAVYTGALWGGGGAHSENTGSPRKGCALGLFFATIDCSRSSLMDLPRKLSTVYSRSHQGASEPSFRRRLPRILVVDDNPNTMSLMQDLLASRGYDVVAVPD